MLQVVNLDVDQFNIFLGLEILLFFTVQHLFHDIHLFLHDVIAIERVEEEQDKDIGNDGIQRLGNHGDEVAVLIVSGQSAKTDTDKDDKQRKENSLLHFLGFTRNDGSFIDEKIICDKIDNECNQYLYQDLEPEIGIGLS